MERATGGSGEKPRARVAENATDNRRAIHTRRHHKQKMKKKRVQNCLLSLRDSGICVKVGITHTHARRHTGDSSVCFMMTIAATMHKKKQKRKETRINLRAGLALVPRESRLPWNGHKRARTRAICASFGLSSLFIEMALTQNKLQAAHNTIEYY